MKKIDITTFIENLATLKELLSRISPDSEIHIPDIVVKIPVKSPMDEIAKGLKLRVSTVTPTDSQSKPYKAIVLHLKHQNDFSTLAFKLNQLLEEAQKLVKKNPFDFSSKEVSENKKSKK